MTWFFKIKLTKDFLHCIKDGTNIDPACGTGGFFLASYDYISQSYDLNYDEIIEREKISLDIFWLKDDSLTDLENLPNPDILANEIIENIDAGLESFQVLMETLNGE